MMPKKNNYRKLPAFWKLTLVRAAWWLFMSPMVVGSSSFAQEPAGALPVLGQPLTTAQADSLARLALSGLDREFPNKPANILTGPESVVPPRDLFPAFYGCYDWHSSVHGHWMLVRILRCHPGIASAGEIRERISAHLTKENLEREAAYFAQDVHRSYERMYGWAWFFRLVIELESWDDPDAKIWRENVQPLEDVLVRRTMLYLPLLTYPIRTGEHPDTGFALGQLVDYSRSAGNVELEKLLVNRAREYYLADFDYPTRYEPSGQDFFSTGWNEADLMRRVLDQPSYSQWLDKFLPGLRTGEMGGLLTPAVVTDVTDGKLVHLAGLNLSRSWCMGSIAGCLPHGDPRRELLFGAARDHAAVGLRTVFSGHYEGEHWLGTFAVYSLTNVGLVDFEKSADK